MYDSVCVCVYSFEVVEGRQDDLVSSSDQTNCRQQLQHQRLGPGEEREVDMETLNVYKQDFFYPCSFSGLGGFVTCGFQYFLALLKLLCGIC